MTITDEQIKEWMALCEAATNGPVDEEHVVGVAEQTYNLAVAARAALPALIAEREALKAELDAVFRALGIVCRR